MLNKLTYATLLAALTLSGCSTVKNMMPDDEKVDYKRARTEARLELPPDINSSAIEDTMVVPSATYSEFQGINQGQAATSGQSKVLAQPEGIRLVDDGNQRWLVVSAAPEAVWTRVYDFWLSNGFLMTLENPQIGIMETDWAENRADIDSGPIRNLLKKSLDFLYSAATRDKFRVRLERGDATDTTEVYLTHRGMEEVATGYEDQDIVWVPREPDPELETEMLKRLMIHLGQTEEQAKQQLVRETQGVKRAQLIKTADRSYLQMEDDFSRGWRRVGIALDRIGFTVEDRNRAEGIYYVRYIDPLKDSQKKGWLSKMKFWGDDKAKDGDRYEIHVATSGAQTFVRVHSADGIEDNSGTAVRILTLLQEQLQ